MANKKIDELLETLQLDESSYFVVTYKGETRKISYDNLDTLVKDKILDKAEYDEASQILTLTFDDNSNLLADFTSLAKKTDIPKIDDTMSSSSTNPVQNKIVLAEIAKAGHNIDIVMDSTTYVVTFNLRDKGSNIISTAELDLPLEATVISGKYDNVTKELILILRDKTEIKIPVGDLINGLVSDKTFNATVNEINGKIADLISKHDKDVANINKELKTHSDDIGNNTTSISEITKEQTTQNEKIATNTNKNIEQDKELESIKSNLINLTTDKAEEIQVNDSSDLQGRISVYGNTKQETTQGYNLFTFLPKGGEQGKYNNNSVQLINWKGYEYFDYNNEEIKTKTLGKTITITTILNGYYENDAPTSFIVNTNERQYAFQTVLRNGNYINEIQTETIKLNPTEYIKSMNIYCKNNTSKCNINMQIMIELGDKFTKMEKYTGGEASPNPSFPQEVESVKAYNLFDGNYIKAFLGEGANKYMENPTTRSALIPCKSNKNYYIKKYDTSTRFRIANFDNLPTNGVIGTKLYFVDNGNEIAIKTSANAKYLMVFVSNAEEEPKMQIVEGNKPKPYQAYGQIEVEQTGKNIAFNNTSKGILNSLGQIENSEVIDVTPYISIDKGITITCSGKIGNAIMRIGRYDKNKNFIDRLLVAYNEMPYIIKPTDTTKYVRLSFENRPTDKLENLQVEYGIQPTPYEPYKQTLYPLHLGSIELNKIGDSQDYFYKDLASGKWYEKKHYLTERLVPSMNFVAWSTKDNSKYRLLSRYFDNKIKKTQSPADLGNIKSNFYTNITANQTWTLVQGICVDNYGNVMIYDNKNYNNDTIVTNFNKMITDNAVYLTYELATPQDIEITNPELIEDLERLYKAKTFKPTTILSNNSIAIMKLDYIADTKTYIDNKFKQMTAQIEQTNKAIVASEGGNV